MPRFDFKQLTKEDVQDIYDNSIHGKLDKIIDVMRQIEIYNNSMHGKLIDIMQQIEKNTRRKVHK